MDIVFRSGHHRKKYFHEFDLLHKRVVKRICKESHMSYSDEGALIVNQVGFFGLEIFISILPIKFSVSFCDRLSYVTETMVSVFT